MENTLTFRNATPVQYSAILLSLQSKLCEYLWIYVEPKRQKHKTVQQPWRFSFLLACIVSQCTSAKDKSTKQRPSSRVRKRASSRSLTMSCRVGGYVQPLWHKLWDPNYWLRMLNIGMLMIRFLWCCSYWFLGYSFKFMSASLHTFSFSDALQNLPWCYQYWLFGKPL